jgi:hypothetical protein
MENAEDAFEFEPGPLRVPKGLKIYTNTNGMSVMELHHTADPEKDWAWARAIKAKTPKEQLRDWDREMNLIDLAHEGKPFWTSFNPQVHAAEHKFTFVEGSTYMRGYDFGLQPAVAFIQKLPSGQLQVFAELCFRNASAIQAAAVMNAFCREMPVARWEDYGDPAGGQRSQTDGRTPFDVFADYGVYIQPVPFDLNTRRDAVNWLLMENVSDAPLVPRLWIDRMKCPILYESMMGGYKVRVTTVGNEELHQEEPLKNFYSHINEAFQAVAVAEYMARMSEKTYYDPKKRSIPRVKNRLNYRR